MLTARFRTPASESYARRRWVVGLFAAAVFCFATSAFADVVLQGTVTDRDTAQPLVGANVYLQSTASGTPATVTDGSGSYTIDASQVSGPSGPITFQASGHFVVQTSYDTSTATTLDVSLLASVTTLVQGTVRDSGTTLPIASASLSFANGSFSATGSGPVATTDSSGLYAFDASLFFESAAAGFDSSLTASAAGYFSRSGPLSTYAPPFPITQDFNLLSATGTVLQGTVTDRDSGQPLVGANVYLRSSATGSPAAITDGNGSYTIDGSQVSSTAGSIAFQSAAHFVIQTSYDITTIPTTLDVSLLAAATPLVDGTVRDSATTLPIASANLSFANTGSFSAVGSGPVATTDGNGFYSFDASLFFESASTGFTSHLTAAAIAYVSQDGPSTTYAPPFPVTQDFDLVWNGTTRDITITTNPGNLTITADSVDHVAPHVFAWIPGSPHTVAVGSPQSGPAGTQYRFGSWSDGGAASHSISTPNADTTITAQFITQYLLTTAVAPALGGAVTSGGWFDSGTVVSIAATPAAGYQFSGFSGDLSGTDNPQNVTMNAATSVTANFSPVTFLLTVTITGSGSGTVTSDDGKINCPGDCTEIYDNDTSTTLHGNAGGSSTFTGFSGACTGTAACVVTMDADKTVTATFVVSGRDLVVSAVSNPPGVASPGSVYTITDTTLNQGAVLAGTSTTRFYLSLDAVKSSGDKLLTGVRAVPSLDTGVSSGGPTTVTIPASLTPGTYFQLACADDKKDVAESNEANNCRASATTIQVTLPDLLESAVGGVPSTIAPGDKFTVTDTVLNQNAIDAAASTTRYYLSIDLVKDAGDVLLTGARSVPALAPGASSAGSKQVTVPTTTPFDTYRVLACADDLAKVTETNETNNCLAANGSIVVGLPDLITTQVFGFPSSATPGQKISISDRVVNQGSVTSAGSSTRYYLSVDGVWDAADLMLLGARSVPPIAPTARSTAAKKVTVPTTTPAGTYHVIACADDLKKVAESNEGNNCFDASASPDTIVIGP